jgi:hypothetical protein
MSETQWGDRATRHLKAELKRASVTYSELARRMNKAGFEETQASIANKFARGTYSAAFFLGVLSVIGADTLSLDDLG